MKRGNRDSDDDAPRVSLSPPRGDILPAVRRDWLVRQINLTGHLVVAEAAEALGVSRVTLRRDLESLTRSGRIGRVHGGAVSVSQAKELTSPRVRVGVIVPQVRFYFPVVMAGIEQVADRANAQVIFATHLYQAERERSRLERLLELGLDALLLTTGYDSPEEPDLFAMAVAAGLPTVVLERKVPRRLAESPRLSSVRSNHREGAMIALEHLYSLGHRQVACFISPTMTGRQLVAGAEHVEKVLWPEGGLQYVQIGEGQECNDQARELLTRGRGRPGVAVTAVLGHSDRHTFRLVQVASELGLRVPDDLSVIAYDDVFAGEGDRPLTAMAPPKEQVGRVGMELVLSLMRDPNRPVTQLHLSPSLIDRGTTGPPPKTLR